MILVAQLKLDNYTALERTDESYTLYFYSLFTSFIVFLCKVIANHIKACHNKIYDHLLSNLLDNAIKASEKMQHQRGRSVIHLKLVYDDEKMILAIRNPIIDKVEIIDDNMVVTKENDGHGIGLLNVKAVVDKYEGDMVLSCDNNTSVQDGLEFKVVVVI
jgi:sensor histidine kinase regulating citrate/malate metabolism